MAERYTLGILRQLGYPAAAIARMLGRHRSTIGREVHRNAITYRPQLAHWYACSRRSRSRRNHRFSPADFALVRTCLEQQWSPEQVARVVSTSQCPMRVRAATVAGRSVIGRFPARRPRLS